MHPADRVVVSFHRLTAEPLVVDAVYEGGTAGNRGDDPIQALLGVGNAGGFRIRNNSAGTAKAYGALYSTGSDPDWPDRLDVSSGTFTYHGDQKTPGKELHDTPRRGNTFLSEAFALANLGPQERLKVPPLFLFEKAGRGADVIFRGLLAPGSPVVPVTEQLVAVWRSKGGLRYQNYRATFTVLDAPTISREWFSDLMQGNALGPAAPSAWRHWIDTGNHRALQAARPLEYRTRLEQLPQRFEDQQMLAALHGYFASRPTAFEACAATLFQMLAPAANVSSITRAVVDGGRDAFGIYTIGPLADPVKLDWSLEAKCFAPTTPVVTQHTSRLISRLRHRQFGVLVTTSYVDRQAYRELREDRHPIVVICGADIVEILRLRGFTSPQSVTKWLFDEFPIN